jgi:DNA invertase Pin-like site-specific DNA recombinase
MTQMNKTSRVIGYCRVSTTDGLQKTDLQRDALRTAAVTALYEDHCSGAKTSRPDLDRCLADLQAGDTLVIWRLDRLGRSLPHLLDVVEDLDRRGVHLRSLNDHIDTTTATGRLVFHVLASLAQFERELTAERIAAGVAAYRAPVKATGGASPPLLRTAWKRRSCSSPRASPLPRLRSGSASAGRRCTGRSRHRGTRHDRPRPARRAHRPDQVVR